MTMRRAVAIACLLLALPISRAGEVIHVAYSERPPYTTTQPDGTSSGLTGTPATAAFKAAGIAVQWHRVPANRQLMMVKDSAMPSCAIGWFDSPTRRSYARFTKPIYRDRSWAVLTNAAFAARNIGSLEELSRQHDARVLIKDNFSYGGLDAFLRHWQPVTAVSAAPTLKMVQSVSKGLVDLMLVSEEEGKYIMQHHAGDHAPNLRLLQFKDMPRGGKRAIMCGLAVSDEVLARLNKAIAHK